MFMTGIPPYTLLIFQLFNGLRTFFLPGIGCFAAVAISCYFLVKKISVDDRIVNSFLKIRMLRYLIQLKISHYFCLQIGSLLESGIPMLYAVELVLKSAPNRFYHLACMQVKEGLLAGLLLHEAIEKKCPHFFLPVVAKVIKTGEMSGTTAELLLKLEKQFDEEFVRITEGFLKKMSPLSLLFGGAIIAAIVLALLLPVLNLTMLI
jgi:type II secretory pathway component PulF